MGEEGKKEERKGTRACHATHKAGDRRPFLFFCFFLFFSFSRTIFCLIGGHPPPPTRARSSDGPGTKKTALEARCLASATDEARTSRLLAQSALVRQRRHCLFSLVIVAPSCPSSLTTPYHGLSLPSSLVSILVSIVLSLSSPFSSSHRLAAFLILSLHRCLFSNCSLPAPASTSRLSLLPIPSPLPTHTHLRKH